MGTDGERMVSLARRRPHRLDLTENLTAIPFERQVKGEAKYSTPANSARVAKQGSRGLPRGLRLNFEV